MQYSKVWDAIQGQGRRGGKAHSVIHANEGVHCDVQLTPAAANDSSPILAPGHYGHDGITALDRACISYAKFEALTDRNAVYVTKMKKEPN